MNNPYLSRSYAQCCLCPRVCGIDRRIASADRALGFCRSTDQLIVGYIGPHFGEEPPISGNRGSGTVFLSGCSLRCVFCQNYQISRQRLGRSMQLEEALSEILRMLEQYKVHNINFVSPDHFFPHVFRLTDMLRGKGFNLPVVFNLSGYQSLGSLQEAADFADIYLADFKYGRSSLAAELSKCADYTAKALAALYEMLKQKGFLDKFGSAGASATKGVLVRHLILPGHIKNSLQALTALLVEFGPHLPLSLMSQYHPPAGLEIPEMNRYVSQAEFTRVYQHALELGFENLFVQFPPDRSDFKTTPSPFLPDFRLDDPFGAEQRP